MRVCNVGRQIRKAVIACHVETKQKLSLLFSSRVRQRLQQEREFNLSIQPALAHEDMSMLEPSAKVRMAAKQ